MILSQGDIAKLVRLLKDRSGPLFHFIMLPTKVTTSTGIRWESGSGAHPFVFELFEDENEFREVGQMELSDLQNHLDAAIGMFERELEHILSTS